MKFCSKCKTEKEESLFAWRNKSKGTRQSWCKDCNKQYHSNFYKTNSDRKIQIRTNNKSWREKRYAYIRDILKSGCVDCQTTDIRVLEFDHVLGVKDSGVADLVNKGASMERITKEIEKCEIRCRNCHAIKTYERAGWNW